uniref:glutathione transferase n=1 Tax=Acrobeloides nanus TaxID=290746 RepID=A0A914CFS0_9BILA
MVQYKLSYFPVRGLGEVSRFIFHYANIPFEDNRIGGDDWQKYKSETPFGQMPVLEADGKVLAQSFAIARYLARKHGLAGKDDWESAQLDSIADLLKDFNTELRPYFGIIMGHSKDNKDEVYKTVFKPTLEKNLPILEKLLKDSGSGFFAKSGVSWVDFHVASYIETLEGLGPDVVANYKEITKHKAKVYALPQLKKYLDSRPKTQF